MFARSAVVLGGICHEIDFVGGEPLAQTLVGTHKDGAVGVVVLTPLCQANIVVGGSHQQHGFIHIGIILRQFMTCAHHSMGVVALMPCIEAVVERHNASFEKICYFGVV